MPFGIPRSFIMKIFEYVLEKDQYLSDLDLNIGQDKISLLTAPTGTGKTTFTMETLLTQYETIVLLVPAVFKVKELQAEYRSTKKIKGMATKAHYQFFYDEKVPSDKEINGFKGVIISTYDKFSKIDDILTKHCKQNALLVIDECHKLYSVGSFRDAALNPIIISLQENKYSNVLLMTATHTFERWETLEIPLHCHHQVRVAQPIKHKLKVVELRDSHKYAFVQLILDRVDAIQLKRNKLTANDDTILSVKKKIIVRLNSRTKCEQLSEFFQVRHKLKCMVVHSKNKQNELVDKLFKEQKIPSDIDVVFTTSILDEAVNINNYSEEMDSVFIIGRQAHPEEIVQFMGRLRNARVPCILVLTHAIDQQGANDVEAKIEELYYKFEDKISLFTKRMSEVGELLSKLVDDYETLIFDTDAPYGIYDKAKRLNATFEELCDVKLFTVYEGKIRRNFASISANNYRFDCAQSYKNYHYFVARIEDLIDACQCSLTLKEDLDEPLGLTEFIKQQDEISEAQYMGSIDDALQIFALGPSSSDLHDYMVEQVNPPTAMMARAGIFSQKLQLDENYFFDLAKRRKVKHPFACASILEQVNLLARHISNLNDIKMILQKKETNKVLVAANGYANNIMVQYLIKRFYKIKPERYMRGDYKVTGPKAEKILLSSVDSVIRKSNIPLTTIIKKRHIKGLHYDSKTKELKCSTSKAFNFIAKYFDVDDKNRNKPNQRYLCFNNIAIGGYEFNALNGIQLEFLDIKPTITINGIEFDAYSCERPFSSLQLDECDDEDLDFDFVA